MKISSRPVLRPVHRPRTEGSPLMAVSHSAHTGFGEDHAALVIPGWLTGGDFALDRPGPGLWAGSGSGSVAVLSHCVPHPSQPSAGWLIALAALPRGQPPASATETFRWSQARIIGSLPNGTWSSWPATSSGWGAMRLSAPVGLGPLMLWVCAVLTHPADVPREPAHRRLGARPQIHQVPGDRPAARDVRSRAAPGASCARLTESRCAPRRRTSTGKPPPPGPAPGCRTSPTCTRAA